jgi:cell division protein FtsL
MENQPPSQDNTSQPSVNQNSNSSQVPAQQPQKTKVTKKLKRFAQWIVLILLVIGAVAGTYYYQQQQIDTLNKEIQSLQSSSSTKPSGTDDAVEQEAIPDGWVEYENRDLKLSFAHPEVWGSVKVAESSDPHTGKHYFLSFTKEPHFTMAAKSSDYKYTGLGKGAPSVNGFSESFDLWKQQTMNSIDSSKTNSLVSNEQNLLVYTHFNGVSGELIVHGGARLDDFPGLEFGLGRSFEELKLTNAVIDGFAEGQYSTKNFLPQNDIATVQLFAKYVKAL